MEYIGFFNLKTKRVSKIYNQKTYPSLKKKKKILFFFILTLFKKNVILPFLPIKIFYLLSKIISLFIIFLHIMEFTFLKKKKICQI